MQLVHLILPSLATLALGSALLMPHREDNPKRRSAPTDSAPETTDQPAAAAFERLVDESRAFEGLADVAIAPSVSSEHSRSFGSANGALRMNKPEPLTACEINDAPAEARPPHKEPWGPGATASLANSDRDESERVVPLTRRRLRRQIAPIEWPRIIDPSRTACGPEERAALLRSIDTLAQGDVRERALLEALDEEAGELRLVALRSLAQSPPAAGAPAFAEILVHGTDEERALAIDVLLAIEQREALVHAFGDRVDAIAAKAVFGYVGSRRRADYVNLLETRFERPRCEAILTLLAGALD